MKVYAKKEKFRHPNFDVYDQKTFARNVTFLADVEIKGDPFERLIVEFNGTYYVIVSHYPKADIILVEECNAIDPDSLEVGEGPSNESEAKCPVCGFMWKPESLEEDYDAACGCCGAKIAVTPNVTVTYDVALMAKPDILHIGGTKE